MCSNTAYKLIVCVKIFIKNSSESVVLRTEQLWVIWYCVRCALTSKQMCHEMEGLYDTYLMPKRTVWRWPKEFCDVYTTATSLPRNRRLWTSLMEVNKNMMAVLIAEDMHILQEQLVEVMDMSKMSVRRIVRALGMRWMSLGNNACTFFQITVVWWLFTLEHSFHTHSTGNWINLMFSTIVLC